MERKIKKRQRSPLTTGPHRAVWMRSSYQISTIIYTTEQLFPMDQHLDRSCTHIL